MKVYICAGLFLVLTAMKLLFPGQALSLRQQVRELIERNDDYSQMAEALGKSLTEVNPIYDLMEAFHREEVFGLWKRGQEQEALQHRANSVDPEEEASKTAEDTP